MNYQIHTLRKVRFSFVLLAVTLLVFSYWADLAHSRIPNSTSADSGSAVSYAPQLSRNAEWDSSNAAKGFTDDQIRKITGNTSYEIIPKFADGFNIKKHFEDAKRLVTAGNVIGNHIKVYEYFSGAFWFNNNNVGWADFGGNCVTASSCLPSFNSSWELLDNNQAPVPFFGIGGSAEDDAVGYMYDLTNPAYRAWAVNTVTAWMKTAPYNGVALDSSNVLIGNSVRATTGDGKQTWNDLLCGTGSWDADGSNCPRVTAWNNGLTSLISEMRAALNPLGDEVIYNGIGPSAALRGPARNLGLLAQADIATNEGFCFDAAAGVNSDRLNFESITDDANIMRTQALAGKKIFEITNFQTDSKLQYGDYCVAGFLMGWQPGYDFQIFHKDYTDPLAGNYPYPPEQNFNLGLPVGDYGQSGTVLSRSFQNGFVATNISDAQASVNLPTAGTQFADGKQGSTFAAGSSVNIPARSGVFFLTTAYLHPAPASSGSNSRTTTPGMGQAGISATAGGTNIDSTVGVDGATTTTSQPLNGELSGILKFYTTSTGDVVKVEYLIDGKLLGASTTFPATTDIDISKLSNGEHQLLIKYYHKDSTVTTVAKELSIFNELSVGQLLKAAVKRAALPTIFIVGLLLAIFFIVRRVLHIAPHWLYKHDPHSAAITMGAMATTATVLPPYVPGATIVPNQPVPPDEPTSVNRGP